MKTPSINQSEQNGMVYAKNVLTNKIERIAIVTGLQVGLPSLPQDLQVFGATSFSSKLVKLLENNEYQMDMETSYLFVEPSGSSNSVVVYLPKGPRLGQVVYIKDASGNAASVAIVVNAGEKNQTIDGSYSQTINSKLGFINLIWNGNEWSILSSPSKGIMMFGCSTLRAGTNTDYLNPGGVSLSASTSDNRKAPCPSNGTIRNLNIIHNSIGTVSAPADITYTILVNGIATSIIVNASATSTSTTSNIVNRAVVVAGDQISIKADIPANVTNAPDRISATFEIVS